MEVREVLRSGIDGRRDELTSLSHGVHADAEIGFEEHTSSQRVAAALDAGGFDVRFGVDDLDTAFVATAGSGPLTVGICAEYDALPGIGHACGHNVIAAAAVGAGLALAEVADDLGVRIRVIGTPAEEGGGGKILLMERGAFDGLHAAMMVHPAPNDAPGLDCLAVRHLDVTYSGKAAHAAASPELGVNAADALTIAQVGVGLLRQHIRPTDRVHGIITHGGDAPNIVPDRVTGTWFARSATLAELAELYPKLQRCFEAGALATGAQAHFAQHSPAYSEFLPDTGLLDLYLAEAEAIGRRFPDPEVVPPLVGSTDMANVSLAMPTIHPMVGVEANGATNHQVEFTAACAGASADVAVRDGALGLARTVVAATEDDGLRDRLLSRSFSASGSPPAG